MGYGLSGRARRATSTVSECHTDANSAAVSYATTVVITAAHPNSYSCSDERGWPGHRRRG